MTWRSLLFLSLLTFIFSCGSNTTEEKGKSDNMAQFTKDESFKKSHELPDSLAFTGKGEMLSFKTPDGKTATAYTIKAKEETNKYLFVIHEWWGLNDHIKQEAERFYAELGDVHVMALDIYDGNVATTREQASEYMGAVVEERAEAIIKGALNYAGSEAEIGTIGWCFGGGWSLKSSIIAGAQSKACVIYYGMPVQEAKQLMPLEAEVLGIFAESDGWITPEVVDKFDSLMKATKKTGAMHQFPANHGFANPSSPRYDEASAQKANAMSLSFLKEKL